ncbi:MAG: photoactive yellow protein [Leptospiraceae bacterium]|nr:photoactive yellow protein [Leptospiraceae bacterium]MBK7057579.1 photoactive yellow protein [Leptospiraceae bacterium]MBK9500663.1 photoactive yellow protein [Leptospiraceae bacterium]MBL0266463.1 photoactive yellow protein [Leptospiraceae bacterium]
MEDFAKGILYNLGHLSRDQADNANFGIVKVDDQGQILLYNKYESDLAGVPVASAEGKNFFTQVAICTNNRLFFGKFKDGVTSGHLDSSFNYVFTYKMKPTNVMIQLYRDQATSTNWIFVKKK